jgi:hypothetical protein
MGSSIEAVLEKLDADAQLVSQFRDAYGRAPDRASLLDAIAIYERSLLTPGSRFDRWLGGDTSALAAEELSGYQLFESLDCVSCHQGVNVGGNLFERHGIFRPLGSPKPEILRVPSLRNVAMTAPYFHDGSAPTLAEAVRQMAAAQLDRALSDQQVAAIVAFLDTLTRQLPGRPRPCGTALRIAPALAAVPLLILLLTWLSLRASNTDADRFDRALNEIDHLASVEASLHGNVLRARAGMLRNYDVLVLEANALDASLGRLRDIAAIDSRTNAAVDNLAAFDH